MHVRGVGLDVVEVEVRGAGPPEVVAGDLAVGDLGLVGLLRELSPGHHQVHRHQERAVVEAVVLVRGDHGRGVEGGSGVEGDPALAGLDLERRPLGRLLDGLTGPVDGIALDRGMGP